MTPLAKLRIGRAIPSTLLIAVGLVVSSCASGTDGAHSIIAQDSMAERLQLKLEPEGGERAQVDLAVGGEAVRSVLPLPNGRVAEVEAFRHDDGHVEVVLHLNDGVIGRTAIADLRPNVDTASLDLWGVPVTAYVTEAKANDVH